MNVIEVLYGGVNITSNVMWSGTSFESSAGAIPGSASIRCRDMDQSLSFITGTEIQLKVDGELMWGGYLRNVNHTYAFDADDIPDADAYTKRFFELECVDYNVLFDKRVLRNPSNYTDLELAAIPPHSYDGDSVKYVFSHYIDVPSGFDTTSEVENIGWVTPSATLGGTYEAQGTYLRDQLKTFAKFTAPVYYFSADKKLHWHALENVIKRWGFSDRPNNVTITPDPGFQGAYRGFQSCKANEDGSPITNDALIWGGTVAGSNATVIFAREQDTDSQEEHGRWQLGEVHVGESSYGNQDAVDVAADIIVNGPPGAVGEQVLRGLRFSQWSFSFSWMAYRVPFLSGSYDHIRAGDLVWIKMEAFGIERLLPCRRLTFTALNVDANGNGIVQFSGEFALGIEDPWQLWNFLLARQAKSIFSSAVTVTNEDGTTQYGAVFQDVPSPLPNGSNSYFEIPFGYITGTLDVYMNGLLQRHGVDYIESDNVAGQFQMSSPPNASDTLYVICRTLAE